MFVACAPPVSFLLIHLRLILQNTLRLRNPEMVSVRKLENHHLFFISPHRPSRIASNLFLSHALETSLNPSTFKLQLAGPCLAQEPPYMSPASVMGLVPAI